MATTDQIRPFSFRAPDEELVDLRRRINATKWPDQEQVTDDSQGVRLATAQKLALLGDRPRLAQDRGSGCPRSGPGRYRWTQTVSAPPAA